MAAAFFVMLTVNLTSNETYLRLLERAISKVSKDVTMAGDRIIEIKPNLVFDAKNTVLTNLAQIAKSLNREPEHFARFLLKETGRAGAVSDERLTIQGRLTADEMKKLIELYVKEFVRCPVCNGIDTRIVSEKRFRFLVCDACGAKNPVRRI